MVILRYRGYIDIGTCNLHRFNFICMIIFEMKTFKNIRILLFKMGIYIISMDTQIKFLTLNMFLRPPGIKTNSSDFKDLRTRILIESILPQFDLVILQEVFSTLSSRKSLIISESEKLGFLFSQIGPEASPFSGTFTDSGLLVLSRFPILESDEITYEDSMSSDRLSSKGATYSKIQIGSSCIHLFSTHLQSSYTTFDYQEFLRYRMIRRKQLVQLKKFIDLKTAGLNETVLIGGDFNIDGKEIIKPPLFQVIFRKMNSQDDYENMYAILSDFGNEELVDVVLIKYEQHLATFGIVDERGLPKEKVLTHADDARLDMCLDYIFLKNSKVRIR
jgi:endonuclease/exonuclease/phosphatase family metal-dependent hydrolase